MSKKMQMRTDEDIKNAVIFHICSLIALIELKGDPLTEGEFLGTFDFKMTRLGTADLCEIHVGQLDIISKEAMQ